MKMNNKGFTLVEVICTVALLGIIMTASANIFSGILLSQRNNKEQLYANNMAQDILERVTYSGDLSEYNHRTYTKDGIDYYVEITATARPDVVGSSSSNGASDDDEENDSIIKDITFEKETLPPQGTTVPAQTAKPGVHIKGSTGDYNLKIQVFDFIDEDMPMLITAGRILAGDNDSFYSAEQIYNILNASSEFAAYNTNTPSAGGVATNLQKAVTCYRNMKRSDIRDLVEDHFVSGASASDLYGWEHVISAFEGQIPSPATFSGNMWLMSATDTEKAALAQRMYDYLTCGDDVNFYNSETGDNVAARVTYVCEYFEDNILGQYDAKDVITGTGIPFFDGIEYETLTTNILKRTTNWDGTCSFSGCVGNVYEALNRAEIASNHQGPCLLGKIYKNDDVCFAYDIAWSTKLWNSATITLQVAGRGVQCSTFQGMATSWGDSACCNPYKNANGTITSEDHMDEAHWGVGIKDILTSHGYYQYNIIDEFCFYIDGGLSYRDLTLRAMFNDCGSWCWDDVNAPNGMHKPAIYYFTNLEYESEGASYELDLYDPYDWAADEESDRAGDDTPPVYIPDGGPGVEYQEGTDRHNVTDEDVTTSLSFAIKGLECYNIKIRQNNSVGPVLAELVAYGTPAKATPTPDPSI